MAHDERIQIVIQFEAFNAQIAEVAVVQSSQPPLIPPCPFAKNTPSSSVNMDVFTEGAGGSLTMYRPILAILRQLSERFQ